MSLISYPVDDRLLADSHELFVWQQYHIRLNKNASIPWFLIIPETNQIEYCDLPIKQQNEISLLGKNIGQYLKTTMGAEKINFAAIGNVVQQLHVHVIGRNRQDPQWPGVVWGASLPSKEYTSQQINVLKSDLYKLLAGEQP
ncbi:MAG: HIT domain-containing protein [Xanthomonadales bacterium]|nr:HIT domain-containing protein [Xanthomonadales bacterium]